MGQKKHQSVNCYEHSIINAKSSGMINCYEHGMTNNIASGMTNSNIVVVFMININVIVRVNYIFVVSNTLILSKLKYISMRLFKTIYRTYTLLVKVLISL